MADDAVLVHWANISGAQLQVVIQLRRELAALLACPALDTDHIKGRDFSRPKQTNKRRARPDDRRIHQLAPEEWAGDLRGVQIGCSSSSSAGSRLASDEEGDEDGAEAVERLATATAQRTIQRRHAGKANLNSSDKVSRLKRLQIRRIRKYIHIVESVTHVIRSVLGDPHQDIFKQILQRRDQKSNSQKRKEKRNSQKREDRPELQKVGEMPEDPGDTGGTSAIASDHVEQYHADLMSMNVDALFVDEFIWKSIAKQLLKFWTRCCGELKELQKSMTEKQCEDIYGPEWAAEGDKGKKQDPFAQVVVKAMLNFRGKLGKVKVEKRTEKEEKASMKILKEVAERPLEPEKVEINARKNTHFTEALHTYNGVQQILEGLSFHYNKFSGNTVQHTIWAKQFYDKALDSLLESTDNLFDMNEWVATELPELEYFLREQHNDLTTNLRTLERRTTQLDQQLQHDQQKRALRRNKIQEQFIGSVHVTEEIVSHLTDNPKVLVRELQTGPQIKEKKRYTVQDLVNLTGLTASQVRSCYHRFDVPEAGSANHVDDAVGTDSKASTFVGDADLNAIETDANQTSENQPRQDASIVRWLNLDPSEKVVVQRANLMRSLKKREELVKKRMSRMTDNMTFRLERSVAKDVAKSMEEIRSADEMAMARRENLINDMKRKHGGLYQSLIKKLQEVKTIQQRWSTSVEILALQEKIGQLKERRNAMSRKASVIDSEIDQLREILNSSVSLFYTLRLQPCTLDAKTLKLTEDPCQGAAVDDNRGRIATVARKFLVEGRRLPVGATSSLFLEAAEASPTLGTILLEEGLTGTDLSERLRKVYLRAKDKKSKQKRQASSTLGSRMNQHTTSMNELDPETEQTWEEIWQGMCDGIGPRSRSLCNLRSYGLAWLEEIVDRIGLLDQRRIDPLPRHHVGIAQLEHRCYGLERTADSLQEYWEKDEIDLTLLAECSDTTTASGDGVGSMSLAHSLQHALVRIVASAASSIRGLQDLCKVVSKLHDVSVPEWDQTDWSVAEDAEEAPTNVSEPGLRRFVRETVLKRVCLASDNWCNGIGAVLESVRTCMNLHNTIRTLDFLEVARANQKDGNIRYKNLAYFADELDQQKLVNIILRGALRLAKLVLELHDATPLSKVMESTAHSSVSIALERHHGKRPAPILLKYPEIVLHGPVYKLVQEHTEDMNNQLRETLALLGEEKDTINVKKEIDTMLGAETKTSIVDMLKQGTNNLNQLILFWRTEDSLLREVANGNHLRKWRRKLRSFIGDGVEEDDSKIMNKRRMISRDFPQELVRYEKVYPKLPTAAQLQDWAAVLRAERQILMKMKQEDRSATLWCLGVSVICESLEPKLLRDCRQHFDTPDSLVCWGFAAVFEFDSEKRFLTLRDKELKRTRPTPQQEGREICDGSELAKEIEENTNSDRQDELTTEVEENPERQEPASGATTISESQALEHKASIDNIQRASPSQELSFAAASQSESFDKADQTDAQRVLRRSVIATPSRSNLDQRELPARSLQEIFNVVNDQAVVNDSDQCLSAEGSETIEAGEAGYLTEPDRDGGALVARELSPSHIEEEASGEALVTDSRLASEAKLSELIGIEGVVDDRLWTADSGQELHDATEFEVDCSQLGEDFVEDSTLEKFNGPQTLDSRTVAGSLRRPSSQLGKAEETTAKDSSRKSSRAEDHLARRRSSLMKLNVISSRKSSRVEDHLARRRSSLTKLNVISSSTVQNEEEAEASIAAKLALLTTKNEHLEEEILARFDFLVESAPESQAKSTQQVKDQIEEQIERSQELIRAVSKEASAVDEKIADLQHRREQIIERRSIRAVSKDASAVDGEIADFQTAQPTALELSNSDRESVKHLARASLAANTERATLKLQMTLAQQQALQASLALKVVSLKNDDASSTALDGDALASVYSDGNRIGSTLCEDSVYSNNNVMSALQKTIDQNIIPRDAVGEAALHFQNDMLEALTAGLEAEVKAAKLKEIEADLDNLDERQSSDANLDESSRRNFKQKRLELVDEARNLKIDHFKDRVRCLEVEIEELHKLTELILSNLESNAAMADAAAGPQRSQLSIILRGLAPICSLCTAWMPKLHTLTTEVRSEFREASGEVIEMITELLEGMRDEIEWLKESQRDAFNREVAMLEAAVAQHSAIADDLQSEAAQLRSTALPHIAELRRDEVTISSDDNMALVEKLCNAESNIMHAQRAVLNDKVQIVDYSIRVLKTEVEFDQGILPCLESCEVLDAIDISRAHEDLSGKETALASLNLQAKVLKEELLQKRVNAMEKILVPLEDLLERMEEDGTLQDDADEEEVDDDELEEEAEKELEALLQKGEDLTSSIDSSCVPLLSLNTARDVRNAIRKSQARLSVASSQLEKAIEERLYENVRHKEQERKLAEMAKEHRLTMTSNASVAKSISVNEGAPCSLSGSLRSGRISQQGDVAPENVQESSIQSRLLGDESAYKSSEGGRAIGASVHPEDMQEDRTSTLLGRSSLRGDFDTKANCGIRITVSDSNYVADMPLASHGFEDDGTGTWPLSPGRISAGSTNSRLSAGSRIPGMLNACKSTLSIPQKKKKKKPRLTLLRLVKGNKDEDDDGADSEAEQAEDTQQDQDMPQPEEQSMHEIFGVDMHGTFGANKIDIRSQFPGANKDETVQRVLSSNRLRVSSHANGSKETNIPTDSRRESTSKSSETERRLLSSESRKQIRNSRAIGEDVAKTNSQVRREAFSLDSLTPRLTGAAEHSELSPEELRLSTGSINLSRAAGSVVDDQFDFASLIVSPKNRQRSFVDDDGVDSEEYLEVEKDFADLSEIEAHLKLEIHKLGKLKRELGCETVVMRRAVERSRVAKPKKAKPNKRQDGTLAKILEDLREVIADEAHMGALRVCDQEATKQGPNFGMLDDVDNFASARIERLLDWFEKDVQQGESSWKLECLKAEIAFQSLVVDYTGVEQYMLQCRLQSKLNSMKNPPAKAFETLQHSRDVSCIPDQVLKRINDDDDEDDPLSSRERAFDVQTAIELEKIEALSKLSSIRRDFAGVRRNWIERILHHWVPFGADPSLEDAVAQGARPPFHDAIVQLKRSEQRFQAKLEHPKSEMNAFLEGIVALRERVLSEFRGTECHDAQCQQALSLLSDCYARLDAAQRAGKGKAGDSFGAFLKAKDQEARLKNYWHHAWAEFCPMLLTFAKEQFVSSINLMEEASKAQSEIEAESEKHRSRRRSVELSDTKSRVSFETGAIVGRKGWNSWESLLGFMNRGVVIDIVFNIWRTMVKSRSDPEGAAADRLKVVARGLRSSQNELENYRRVSRETKPGQNFGRVASGKTTFGRTSSKDSPHSGTARVGAPHAKAESGFGGDNFLQVSGYVKSSQEMPNRSARRTSGGSATSADGNEVILTKSENKRAARMTQSARGLMTKLGLPTDWRPMVDTSFEEFHHVPSTPRGEQQKPTRLHGLGDPGWMNLFAPPVQEPDEILEPPEPETPAWLQEIAAAAVASKVESDMTGSTAGRIAVRRAAEGDVQDNVEEATRTRAPELDYLDNFVMANVDVGPQIPKVLALQPYVRTTEANSTGHVPLTTAQKAKKAKSKMAPPVAPHTAHGQFQRLVARSPSPDCEDNGKKNLERINAGAPPLVLNIMRKRTNQKQTAAVATPLSASSKRPRMLAAMLTNASIQDAHVEHSHIRFHLATAPGTEVTNRKRALVADLSQAPRANVIARPPRGGLTSSESLARVSTAASLTDLDVEEVWQDCVRRVRPCTTQARGESKGKISSDLLLPPLEETLAAQLKQKSSIPRCYALPSVGSASRNKNTYEDVLRPPGSARF